MTSDEIRNVAFSDFVDTDTAKTYFLREIAAQLADQNFHLALIHRKIAEKFERIASALEGLERKN